MYRLGSWTLVALLGSATSAIGCRRGYTQRDATTDERRAVCALPFVDSAAWRRGVLMRALPMTALLAPETRVVNDGFGFNYSLAWIGSEQPVDTTSATLFASIDLRDYGWLYVAEYGNDIPILTPGSQRTHFAECDVTIDGRPAKVATYIEHSGVTYGTYAVALRLSLGPGSWLRMTGTAPSPVARAHLLYEMRSLRLGAGAIGGRPDPRAPPCDPRVADSSGRHVVSEVLASPGWNLNPDGLGPTFWCEGRDGDRVYGLIVHRTVNARAPHPIYSWYADGYVRFGPPEIWHARIALGQDITGDTAVVADQKLRAELVTRLRSAARVSVTH